MAGKPFCREINNAEKSIKLSSRQVPVLSLRGGGLSQSQIFIVVGKIIFNDVDPDPYRSALWVASWIRILMEADANPGSTVLI